MTLRGEASLADDLDLSRRARLNFWHAAIALDPSPDADGLPAVADLGSAKRGPVLDPDHDGEATRVRVIDAKVEERRRSGAGRRETCTCYATANGCHASDCAPGLLPGERAGAGEGSGVDTGRLLNGGTCTGGCYRSQYKENGSCAFHSDPFQLVGTQHQALADTRQVPTHGFYG
jgi:hypothetical protein